MTEAPPAVEPDAVRRFAFLPARGGLAWGTAGTLALNGSTTLLNFGVVLLLARLIGADGYGAYAFAFAWAMVLASVAGLGLSPLIVRHVAGSRAGTDWGTLRGVLRWSNAVVLGASILTTALAAAIGWLLLRNDDDLLAPFLIGLLLVAPTALTMLRQSAMQGLGKVVLGRVPETLVVPGAFLVLAASAALVMRGSFSASWAVGLLATATVIAFALGMALLLRVLPPEVGVTQPRYDARSWSRSAVPLFLFGVIAAANAQVGTILLGSLSGPADAGVFAVASRVSMVVGFVLVAAAYPLMPVVARLHALGERVELQATVTRVARAVFLATLPVAVAVALLAAPLLGLFGEEFRSGADAVRILVAGELVKAFLGLAGLALVMTGHEADLTRGVAVGAGVNLVLAGALIPLLGVAGAAIAGALGVACTHVLLAWLSRRRLGISGTPLPPSR